MKIREQTYTIVVRILCIALTIIPLFFLPFTQDYYDTNKLLLTLLVALGVFLLWTVTGLIKSSFSFSLSRSTTAFGALAAASLLGLIVTSSNKVEAPLNPLGFGAFAGLFFIILLLPTLLDAKHRELARWTLILSAFLAGLIAIYETIGIGKLLQSSVKFLSDPLWTPTGSTLATASFLLIIAPIALSDTFFSWRKKQESRLAFLIIISIVLLTGLGCTIWQLAHTISGSLLSISDGWTITLEILKNPLHAFFGIGAENFLSAFTIGRPQLLNMGPLWSVRFTTDATTLFHIMTVYGLAGTFALLLLLRACVLTKKKSALWLSRIFSVIILLATPPSLTIFILVLLLFLMDPDDAHRVTRQISKKNVLLHIAIVMIAIVTTIGVLWPLSRSYGAELYFYQSIRAAQVNNGTATYNFQSKAIKLNPAVTRYHIAFSQTSLAIASSLAASTNTNSQTNTASESAQAHDQQVVAQLIQQAISEGKLGVELNPVSVLGWENLAHTYQQLINIAQGADNWAITSYKQAIALDPTNPILRLQLGTVYYQMKNYTDAITQFQIAVALKSNYANAYYNLAEAYKMNKDITHAVTYMQTALSLLNKSSDDYKIASSELTALQQSQPGAPTTTKTSAAPTPTPATAHPSVVLPPDAGPM